MEKEKERETEKRKLLLVAVSVGVFLVIVLSAALLIFTPVAGGAAVAAVPSVPQPIPPIAGTQPALIGPGSVGPRGPASADATEMVRNAGDLQGLQAPPSVAAPPVITIMGTSTEGPVAVPERTSSSGADPSVVISVPKPPSVPAPGSTAAPAASTPARSPASPTASTASRPATPAVSTPAAGAPARPASPASTASTPAASRAAPAVTAAPAAARSPAASTATTTASPSAPARSTTPQPSRVQNDYWIQTGAFSALVRAEDVKETLASKGLSSIIDDRDVDGQTWYRVRVGPYTSENEANYWLALVKAIDGFNESQVRSTQR